MAPEELTLRRAERHLKEWTDNRVVPEGDNVLDSAILAHLKHRRDVARKNLDRALKRRPL